MSFIEELEAVLEKYSASIYQVEELVSAISLPYTEIVLEYSENGEHKKVSMPECVLTAERLKNTQKLTGG